MKIKIAYCLTALLLGLSTVAFSGDLANKTQLDREQATLDDLVARSKGCPVTDFKVELDRASWSGDVNWWQGTEQKSAPKLQMISFCEDIPKGVLGFCSQSDDTIAAFKKSKINKAVCHYDATLDAKKGEGIGYEYQSVDLIKRGRIRVKKNGTTLDVYVAMPTVNIEQNIKVWFANNL